MVFSRVIDHLDLGSAVANHALLAVVLASEAGLLLVGAQTGFLDGPTVLSNMAGDYWVPRHFRDLSARLVRQNGIIVMGVASLLILLWSRCASRSSGITRQRVPNWRARTNCLPGAGTSILGNAPASQGAASPPATSSLRRTSTE